MKVNVSSILCSDGLSQNITEILDISADDFDNKDIVDNEPVKLDGVITNMGDYLLLSGEIDTSLKLVCSRCLEYFDFQLKTRIEEKFSNKTDINQDDFYFFEGDIIDFKEMVIQDILLSLPMKLICKEDCAGLCPQCGKNKNLYNCNCSGENLDPRLSVLNELLKKG